jgi:hypothetical protein
MKRIFIVLIFLSFGLAFGGEGEKPSPQDSSKARKVEVKKFKDEDKDGFNDLRDRGKYEKLLKDVIKEKKGKK